MAATDPETLLTLADYERLAAAKMEPAAHAYVAGGAGDEITQRDNEQAWTRLAVRPRMLVGVDQRDPGVELLGRRRPHPLVTAPTAIQRLAHPDGEIATARAAAATGAIMCLSTLASTTPEALAAAVPDAVRWFQLYVLNDRGVSAELVARAAESGFEALVVTVDLPVLGVRERELRTPLPPARGVRVSGADAAGARGPLTPAQFAALVDPALDWGDIERFVTDSPLPIVLKGILTAEDAVRAAELGVAGVIVSNHGGRQLDTVLSTADALPAIVDAVGDRVDVLVDGGVRRGTDMLKALALGARAVLIGRPMLFGLALGGAEGVQRVIEILLAEFDSALALAGAPQAARLERSFVTPAPWAQSQR
jgi:4-hydroxymandelate oxidase